jgi:hypothetical protein
MPVAVRYHLVVWDTMEEDRIAAALHTTLEKFVVGGLR